jgi:hypothetical protein
MAGVPSFSKHLHPPMVYSEFLKRNEDALLIHVVGGEQTPTTACCFILSNTCNGRNAMLGVCASF